jgi:cation diffusion facilitator family transporter
MTERETSHSAMKQQVTLHSMLAALLLTLIKLAAGLFTGSLGVLSEAAHSGLDFAGTTLTFFSVRVADKPADEDHSYGHGKFESISAFGEALLMTLSCGWIILEAMRRIIGHTVELRHSLWAVGVLLISLTVDIWRARRLKAVAEETGSEALKADAFHFASDIWSTIAVLFGLTASWAGAVLHIGALRYADPLAAMAVSMLILRATMHLLHETLGILTDKTSPETKQKILRELKNVPDVLAVEQLRVRKSGASHFADLTIALPRRFTFERSNLVVEDARKAVQQVLPDADVVIHTIPRETRTESIFDRVRAVAARNNVAVHELSVQSYGGELRVEQHMELDERLSLREAHDFVCRIEAEILKETPELDAVLTHIESEPATIERPESTEQEKDRIEKVLMRAAHEHPQITDVHEVTVSRNGEHVHVSCHCSLPDELPMSDVHRVITELEDRLKLECPEVYRVMIHPEPESDNTR